MNQYREGEEFYFKTYQRPTPEKSFCMQEEPYKVLSIVKFDMSDYVDSMLYTLNQSGEIRKFMLRKDGFLKIL